MAVRRWSCRWWVLPTRRGLPTVRARQLAVRRLVVRALVPLVMVAWLAIRSVAKAATEPAPPARLRLAAAGPRPVQGPAMGVAAVVFQVLAAISLETVVPVPPATAMPFPETVEEAMVVPAMADQETVDQETVVPAMADQVTADQVTAVPETDTVLATAVPETAVPETETVPETVVPATETETVDRSIEEAFFERGTASSDRPVSFDTELAELPLDLEGRELRRAQFTRVVGAIIAALGVGALLALVQPGSNAAEAAPLVALHVAPVEMAEIQLVEPTPAPALPAPSASVEPALSASVVKTPSRAPRAATSATARLRTFVPPVAASPALRDVNRVPPTARFAD